MQNIIALGWSLVYIAVILGLATLIARYSKGASETSRKFVHILVGNWVFISLLFTELWAILIVPFSFIIINSLSMKYNLISAMERKDDSFGTVYYAVSIFALSGLGFITGWKMLPIVGLLTMAYGDGFAAITGKRWGKVKPFSFAPDKSLVGSLTVAIAAIVSTLLGIYVFTDTSIVSEQSILKILLIALSNGIFASLIELTGSRGSDNISLPIGTGVFATLSFYFGDISYVIYLSIAVFILVFAYRKKSITLDGTVAAFLTAVLLYAFGGIWVASSLILFFVLGSFVSKLNNDQKRKAESLQEDTGARTWKQVLSNSFPAVVMVVIVYFFPDQMVLRLLALAVFAAAAADTFSSELGMLSKAKVFNILNFKPIEKGLSGGVSWIGLLAGLLGSTLIALLAFPEFGLRGFIVSIVIGFMGSIIDSILGAVIQRKYVGTNGGLQDKPNHPLDKPIRGFKWISNGMVNFLSLSIVSIVGALFII